MFREKDTDHQQAQGGVEYAVVDMNKKKKGKLINNKKLVRSSSTKS